MALPVFISHVHVTLANLALAILIVGTGKHLMRLETLQVFMIARMMVG
jgi:hypothetical protein